MTSSALAASAFLTLLAVAGPPTRHNFTGDYLLGSWQCTVQAANGLAAKRTSYQITGGGSGIFESATTTTAQGRNFVEEANISGNAGYFRWIDIYTRKGWRTSAWWAKGVIRWEDFNGGGKTLTLTQVSHTKYTAEVDSLMNPPVESTCLRR